jgi:uncharacterized membrane protein (DUF485 family)
MAGTPQPSGDADGAAAVARSPAYGRLVAARRRFTLVAGGLFYGLLATFAVLAAWAHDWMGTRVVSGLTAGYLVALAVFIAVWVLAFVHARMSIRVFDPLAEQAQEPPEP